MIWSLFILLFGGFFLYQFTKPPGIEHVPVKIADPVYPLPLAAVKEAESNV